MLNRFLLGILLVSGLQTSLFAQAEKEKKDVAPAETPKELKFEKKHKNRLYSLPQFWHETILFAKQPTKWKGKDWLTVGTLTATTFLAMPFDERIAESSQGNQRFVFLGNMGTLYGEWYSIVGVAAAFEVYGLIAKDSIAKKITIELLQAGIYSELLTEVIKVTVGRARPYRNEGAFSFSPFTLDASFQSMPSGHTTSAFALSTVMSRHAKTTFWKIIAYLPAGLTMFARVYQDKHWVSDEILGAGIGFFVGNWVVDLHEGKRHKINVTSLAPLGISIAVNQIPIRK
jgi:membrane-associated phospholipid phosphatase